MVFRSFMFLTNGWKSSILPHKSKVNNEEDSKSKNSFIQADTSDLSIPSHISTDTRDFIYRLLRKDP